MILLRFIRDSLSSPLGLSGVLDTADHFQLEIFSSLDLSEVIPWWFSSQLSNYVFPGSLTNFFASEQPFYIFYVSYSPFQLSSSASCKVSETQPLPRVTIDFPVFYSSICSSAYISDSLHCLLEMKAFSPAPILHFLIYFLSEIAPQSTQLIKEANTWSSLPLPFLSPAKPKQSPSSVSTTF